MNSSFSNLMALLVYIRGTDYRACINVDNWNAEPIGESFISNAERSQPLYVYKTRARLTIISIYIYIYIYIYHTLIRFVYYTASVQLA